MPRGRWRAVESLFADALAQPARQRAAWLTERCGDDAVLEAEVIGLLAADELVHGAALVGETFGDEGDGPIVRGEKCRYRLLDRLGEGGTSTVYLAIPQQAGDGAEVPRTTAVTSCSEGPGSRSDVNGEAHVAVKILRGELDAATAQRFVTEARVLAYLDHPAIARLVDSGTTESGRPFVVTAFVRGEPIDRYCHRQNLDIRARLRLFLDVCEAVREAHQALVIHRDLKPGNVLVREDGQPVLLDFGLARWFGSPGALRAGAAPTETCNRMLTLCSASPEQIRGEPLTTATDVYGLGVLLYRLLAGRAPFAAWHDRPAELARAICERDALPPSRAVGEPARLRTDPMDTDESDGETERLVIWSDRWARRLRGDLDAIVATAMRKRAKHRYPSVGRLADDIRRHLDGRPIRARRAGLWIRAGKLLRRHRVAATAGLTLAVGLLIALATALVQEQRMAEQRNRAEQALSFLVGMLRSADPARAGGKTVTARQMLDTGAERVQTELADQPDLQARLLGAVGSVYLSIGAAEQADAMLSRALALRRTLYGDHVHVELAESLNSLADLRVDQGRYPEAEELYREALAQRRTLHGSRHLEVVTSLRGLSNALRGQARYEEAAQGYREAMTLLEALSATDSADAGDTLNDHAMLLHDRADFDGAQRLYRAALDLRRKLFAGDHPSVSDSLHNLASLLRSQRRFAEAVPLFEESLAMAERLHGRDSASLSAIVQNLGMIALEEADHARAEAYFSRALAIDRAAWEHNHPQIATNVYHLGLVAQRQGDVTGAEPLFRQAIDSYRQTLGDDHPWLAFPLVAYGVLLVETGRSAEAEAVLGESLTIRRQVLDDDHWLVAESENAYAWCLWHLGRRQEARPMLAASLEHLRAALSPDDPRLLGAEARQRVIAAAREG